MNETPVTPELACSGRLSDGGLCPYPPVWGDDKCSELHKGKLKSRQLRRRNNMNEFWIGQGPIKNIDIVRRKNGMPNLGDPIEIDPGVALLQEVHRSAGHVQWLAAKVASLEEDDLVWGKKVESEESSWGDDGKNYTLTKSERRAEISKWYDLYEKERRHLASVSAAALKAGVEERRVRLAERSVQALAMVIIKSWQDMGLDPYTSHARGIIGRRLRELQESGGELYDVPTGIDALGSSEAYVAPEVVDAYWGNQTEEEF